MTTTTRASGAVTERSRRFGCGCVITLIYTNGQHTGAREERCPQHPRATSGSGEREADR